MICVGRHKAGGGAERPTVGMAWAQWDKSTFKCSRKKAVSLGVGKVGKKGGEDKA